MRKIVRIGDLCKSSRTNRLVYSKYGLAPTLMVGGHSANDICIIDDEEPG